MDKRIRKHTIVIKAAPRARGTVRRWEKVENIRRARPPVFFGACDEGPDV